MGSAFKILPYNYFSEWGYMESWASGTSPDGWTVQGTTPVFSSDPNEFKFGSRSLKLVANSNFNKVFQSLTDREDITFWQGKNVTVGGWVKSSNPNSSVYIESDGIGALTGTHSGGGDWEFLKRTIQVPDDATFLQAGALFQTDGTMYADGLVFCEGGELFSTFTNNVDVSSWRPSLDIETREYEIANRQGSFIPRYDDQKKVIAIVGNVVGSDNDSCRTHLDNLIKSVTSWERDKKLEMHLFDDRVLDVFLRQFRWNYVNNLQMVKYNMQFVADLPYSRYINRLRSRQVIAASVTEFNISFDGTAEDLPKIRFTADQGSAISTCTLENFTTKQSFSYIGTVPTNITLEVDSWDATVENSGVDKIDDFTGEFLALVRGTNYLKFSGSDCTLDIDYFNRWHS